MDFKIITIAALCLVTFNVQSQHTSQFPKFDYQIRNRGFISNAHLYIYPAEVYYIVNYNDSAAVALADSMNVMVNTRKSLQLKYNKLSDSIYEVATMKSIYPQGVLIAEKRKAIKWEFVDSTKEINGYLCKLAKGSFRGREYCAWYSLDIDATEIGPWKLHGLPGAIIYAYDTEGFISWKLVDVIYLKKEEGSKMPEEPKLPVVSRAEYRAWRESAFKKLENREAPKGLTYDIKITTDYLEKE